jgi:hypothetical protein
MPQRAGVQAAPTATIVASGAGDATAAATQTSHSTASLVVQKVLSASVGSIITASLLTPLDVAKTRMQAPGLTSVPRLSTTLVSVGA